MVVRGEDFECFSFWKRGPSMNNQPSHQFPAYPAFGSLDFPKVYLVNTVVMYVLNREIL